MKPRLSLKGRGLQLLAQREHSRSELRRKLLAHARATAAADAASAASAQIPDGVGAEGVEPAGDLESVSAELDGQVEAALDWLQAQHHLSEERFIESRVHVRAGRYGNLRIRQELAQHGLSLDADAAQALKESEFTRAREVWARKFASPPQDTTERARQMRFLAARGFSGEAIRHALQGPADE